MYVCTAATQDYAFEAWRVLDTGCTLIPFELLKQRITCVKTHKERKKLSAVLRSKDAIRLPEGDGAGAKLHCCSPMQHSSKEDMDLLKVNGGRSCDAVCWSVQGFRCLTTELVGFA